MVLRISAAALALVAGHALAQQTPTRDQRATHQHQPMSQPMNPGVRPDVAASRATGAMLVPSDWVMGAKVLSSTNQDKIGTVKNLVISPSDGHVEYAIISHGGIAGIGDKLVAVPWDALQYQSKDRVVAIGMTADQLNGAPEFKEDQWSMLGEHSWKQKTHDFFGGSKVGKADNDRDESWMESSNYQQMVQKGQHATVRGTVKDVDNKSPGTDLAEGCIVTVADQSGTQRIVHLGPSWFVKHQQTILKSGDNIEVNGTEFTLDGHDVIAAQTISTPRGTFRFRDEQGRPVWDAAGSTATAQNPTPSRAAQPAMAPGEHHILGTPEMPGSQQYVKASTLDGQDLKTAQGEDAGKVKGFVFDASNGEMSFLVVSMGGFLGIGDDRLAVPWELFTVNSDGKLVLQNVNKDQLKNAPKITKSDWSEVADPSFETRVDQAFGIQHDRTNDRHPMRDHNDTMPSNPDRNPGGGR